MRIGACPLLVLCTFCGRRCAAVVNSVEISSSGVPSYLGAPHQSEDAGGAANDSAVSNESDERDRPEGDRTSTVVVAGWLRLALTSKAYAEVFTRHHSSQLEGRLREAIADSLGVCRSAVSIADMRDANVGVLTDPLALFRLSGDDHHASFAHRVTRTMRRITHRSERSHMGEYLAATPIKVVYEVRVFGEMHSSEYQIARRIDRLQLYSTFSEFDRHLVHLLTLDGSRDFENIVLDDVGYASRRVVVRPSLSASHVADCMEEEALRSARHNHQLIMAACMLLVAMTSCVGSLVFTVKLPSSIPSRMNPLLGSGER